MLGSVVPQVMSVFLLQDPLITVSGEKSRRRPDRIEEKFCDLVFLQSPLDVSEWEHPEVETLYRPNTSHG